MKYIWSKKEARVASVDITSFMKDNYDWTKGSTSKTLQRLVDKEFLKSEKEGRKTYYYYIVNEKDYLKFETQDFFSFVHESSLLSMISSLDNSKSISHEDIKALEDFIEGR